MKFIILLLLISPLALAEELKLTYGPGNELIIKGKICSELIKQHEAICNWRKINEPGFIIPTISKTCKTVGSLKSVTVSSCLPEFVKKYQGKKLARSGANCWGTAMSFKQLSSKPRFLWQEEMIYWINSPVCRKLEVGEAKRPGDIINIYGPEYVFQSEFKDKGYHFWDALYPGRNTPPPHATGYSGFHNFLHSETYITDQLTFGKDSPAYDDRFEFHLMNEVYGRSRTEECQENQSMEPYRREYNNPPRRIKGSHCDYFSLAFRCQNIEKYFQGQKLSADENSIYLSVKTLQAAQEKLFTLQTSSTTTVAAGEIKSILKLADKNSKEALAELQSPQLEKTKEMLLVLKYFSAEGLRKTLEQAGLTPATEEL